MDYSLRWFFRLTPQFRVDFPIATWESTQRVPSKTGDWPGENEGLSWGKIGKFAEFHPGIFHQDLLVGGLEHVLFSHIFGMSSSQLTFIFFRGVAQPPTSKCLSSETDGARFQKFSLGCCRGSWTARPPDPFRTPLWRRKSADFSCGFRLLTGWWFGTFVIFP